MSRFQNTHPIPLEQAIAQLEITSQLIKEGQYKECIPLCEMVIPVFEEAQEWEKYIRSLNDWGKCLWKSGQLKSKAVEMETTLNEALLHLGAFHPETARCYTYLGLAYIVDNKFDMAFECYEKSLQLNLDLFGEIHPEVATNYNNIGAVLLVKGHYDQAISYYEKSLKIHLQTVGELHPDTAVILKNIGLCFSRKGEYDKALGYDERALEIELQTVGELHHETAKSYNDIGHVLYLKGNYESAVSYLKKGLSLRIETLGEMHPETAWSYDNLGNVFNAMGDSEMAIIYAEKGLHIRLQTLGELNMDTSWSYYILGGIHKSKGMTKEAIEYYEKAKEINIKVLGEFSPHLAGIYTNLGIVYYKIGDFKQAIEIHKKSLHLWLKQFGESHPYVGLSYNNLGTVCKKIGEIDAAIGYFEKCLANWLISLGERHKHTAICYHNLGIVHTDKLLYSSAFEYYQKAMVSLLPYFAFESIYSLPDKDQIVPSKELREVLLSFSNDLLQCYVCHSHQKQDLVCAWYFSLLAVQLIDLMRQSYRTDNSKLALGEQAKEVYTNAVNLCWEVSLHSTTEELMVACSFIQQLNPSQKLPLPNQALHQSFYCSEKNKSSVLLSSLNDSEAKLGSSIPPALLELEQELRLELSSLQIQLEEELYKKDELQNAEQIANLKIQLYDLKLKHDGLLAQFERDYPDYYELKYQTKVVNIEQLQASLPLDACLVEYLCSGKQLYIYAVTTNEFVVFQSDYSEDFELYVKDFLRFGVGVNSVYEIDKEEYLHLAYKLYQTLLEPVIDKLALEKETKLIIIPDGILTKLPFEALLVNASEVNEAYSELPYLIQDFEISYHFSATLWHYQYCKPPTKHKQPPSSTYLGIAPVYSDSSNTELPKTTTYPSLEHSEEMVSATRSRVIGGLDCKELVYSEEEVCAIEKMFSLQGADGKTLLHQEATISKFSNEVRQYRYIHIAAHADFKESRPELTGIIFSPEEQSTGQSVLYLTDAYNLQINADLVVLSCCDSGIGEEVNGEGVFAMNRGFLYAGARNVVFTLYKVYDRQSSHLVQQFFHYVLEGMPFGSALRYAKLDMIKIKNTPLFWSGYVLI